MTKVDYLERFITQKCLIDTDCEMYKGDSPFHKLRTKASCLNIIPFALTKKPTTFISSSNMLHKDVLKANNFYDAQARCHKYNQLTVFCSIINCQIENKIPQD